MPKKRILFKHRIEYSVLMIFFFILKLSPLTFFKFYKNSLKRIFIFFDKRYAKIIDKNLKIVFPAMTVNEQKTIKQKIYNHFSGILIEILCLFSKKHGEKILKPIHVKNLVALEKSLAKKRGVIIFSAHFGNWELIPFILSRRISTEIIALARVMNNPLSEKIIGKFRKFMGSTIINKQGSVRTILEKLQQNKLIYMLIDQNIVPREGVPVDFFSTKVYAVASVSQLYIKKQIPIIPLFLHYESDKIVLEIGDELSLPTPTGHANDISQLTQICINLIEGEIKQNPEQWFWFHNRWKNLTLGENGHEKN